MRIEAQPSQHDALRKYPHRVVVAGSRGFDDYVLFSENVFSYLEERGISKEEVCFISGAASSGADALIIRFCKEHGYAWTEHPADWGDISSISAIIRYTRKGKPYNLLAGMWRNAEMAEFGNALLTFYDGVSPGTRDMMKKMASAKHPCRCIVVSTMEKENVNEQS